MTARSVRRSAVHLLLPVLVAAAGLSGCGSSVDLKQTLQITDLSGGWYDAGIKDGKNRLLPTVTFRVKKNTDEDIRPLSLNLSFKRIGLQGQPDEDFDEVFVQSVTFGNDNQTETLTLRPEAGYTGDPPQTRAQMLQNSQFRDMRVTIFGKHSSSNWVEIARYDIPRQLLTH